MRKIRSAVTALILSLVAVLLLTSCADDLATTRKAPGSATAPNQSTYPSTYNAPSSAYTPPASQAPPESGYGHRF